MKKIVSLILALVILVVANAAMCIMFMQMKFPIEDTTVEDTPVAKIHNDTVIPYSPTARQSQIAYASTAFTPVQQTIIVVDKLSGNPISNAIVRIDGVPRFTDRDGQIFVTISKEYVELYVEKNGYNPYIEIMDVIGGNKTVVLKRPQDDIEIYAAMLYFDGMDFNVLTQSVFINEAIEDLYYAEINVMTNIVADEYYLLVNDAKWDYSESNTFYDINFGSLKPGDKISVQVLYSGILSTAIPTFIEIQDENDLYPDGNGDSFGTSPGMNSEKVVEPNFENNDLGIFGGFNIDLVKLLKIKDVLNPSERKSNKNAAFSVSYDARKGIIKVTAGYAYNKFFKNDDDKARYDKAKKALSDYRAESVELHNEIDRLQTELQENDKRLQELQSRQNASQAEINRYKNQIKGFQQRIVEIKEEGKKSSSYLRSQCTQRRIEIDKVATSMRQRDKHVQELINQTNSGKQSVNDMKRRLDAIPDLIREVKNEYAQNQRRFTIDVDVLGVFEYNPKEKSVSNFAVNATLTLNFKFKGTFFAGYIPMFYEVAVNLEFGIEVEFYAENGVWITWDSFLERMLLYGSVTLRGEVGAGVNDVTNISLFAQAMIKLSIYAFAKNNIDEMYIINLKDNLGLEFDWKIGLRVELFLWYFEFVGYGGSLGKDPTLPVSLDPNFQNLMVSAKLSNRYTENTSIAENEVFTSVYNGSKSKLIALDDGRYILTWIEDSYLRDEYNRTILKYAIFNNGVWSQSKAVFDDGRADFYHDTYLVGNNLYVAWQKSNSLFNSDDNYITVGSASEIYTARIDTNSDTVFDVIRQTNNSDLDFAPRFVQREIASEPLAIVWQKNSQNDILGLSGENSIYYKQLIGSAANVIYQTERGISHLAAAFKNGIIAVAFSEDYGCEIVEDESYSPIRLGKIVYGKTTSTIDANGVFGTQFLLRDGEMTLFIHDGKTIIFTDDFVNLYQFSGLADYIVSSSFSIIETATGIAVFYDKMGIDGQQAYVSMFNSESREWTYDIVLSAQDNVRFFNVSGIIDSDGDIWASYNAQNEDMATVLCFSSITPQSDFEIGLTYIDFLENDEISLTIGLRNIGTSNIFKFTVVAFGETHDIYLDNPLRIAEYDYIELVYTDIELQALEYIMVSTKDTVKTQTVIGQKTDVVLSGVSEIVNDVQTFILSITNLSHIDTSITIQAFSITGLIYFEELNVDRDSQTQISVFFDGLAAGESVFFKITPSKSDMYYCDNEIVLTALISTVSDPNIVAINPYADLISHAKRLLI